MTESSTQEQERAQRSEGTSPLLTAAYVPFKSFLTAVEVLEQGLPPRLDRSVWPTLAGSTQGALLVAFRFLGLIRSEGTATDELSQLVAAREGAKKPALAAILVRSYPALQPLAEQNASFQTLQESMREHGGVQGGTLDKAIRFYLEASLFAGLKHSHLWEKARKTSGSSQRRQRRRDGTPAPPPPPTGSGGSTKTVKLRSGGSVTLSVTVDAISMSTKDRDWVFGLVDTLNAYEQQEELPLETSAP